MRVEHHRLLVVIVIVKAMFCVPAIAQKNIAANQKTISIVLEEKPHERLVFGAGKLTERLLEAGYKVNELPLAKLSSNTAPLIIIGLHNSALINKSTQLFKTGDITKAGKEGFSIVAKNNVIVIAGTDETGTLYGCLELADSIRSTRKLPADLSITDQPQMVLRGACIGVQSQCIYQAGRYTNILIHRKIFHGFTIKRFG